MHNLEQLIAEWRKTMMTAHNIGRETLDELENHLREDVDQLVQSGMAEPEAFQRAVTQLGGARTMASEFQKLDQPTWLPVKVITGIGIMAAVLGVGCKRNRRVCRNCLAGLLLVRPPVCVSHGPRRSCHERSRQHRRWSRLVWSESARRWTP